MDGPAKEKLIPIVGQAFPVVAGHLRGTHIAIKDTAAWTIGRICEIVPQAIEERFLPELMNTFIDGLKDEPRVSANIC